MTKKLWAEDINSIGLYLVTTHPLDALDEEAQEAFLEKLDIVLDPYCEGYRNYN